MSLISRNWFRSENLKRHKQNFTNKVAGDAGNRLETGFNESRRFETWKFYSHTILFELQRAGLDILY